MTTNTVKTIIALRRDVESNYRSTFVPLKGEVCVVDTPNDGVRIKIGDGQKTFQQLTYIDNDIRSLIQSIVVKGYYYNNAFYTTQQHTETYVGYDYKVYIDITNYEIYCYETSDSSYHKLNQIANATSTEAGIMKLYDGLGNNTDGTITQLSITSELNRKFHVSTEADETLLFTI